MTQHGGRRSIMVVDDNPANLKLIEDMLGQAGFDVRSFPRGRLALVEAANDPPDLILLDINMPEMTGFDVCRRLKSDERLAQIPVLFLSALSETEDRVRVKALRCGGVDFISKPFQFEEVRARIETHLKLYSLQRTLSFQNERLEQAVAARTKELAEANLRRSRRRTRTHATPATSGWSVRVGTGRRSGLACREHSRRAPAASRASRCIARSATTCPPGAQKRAIRT